MPGDKRKAPKRMFKTADRVSRFVHERSPIGRMKRMAREHEAVLQGIESVLVSGREVDPAVDDHAAAAAIHAALTDTVPDDPRVAPIARELAAERAAHDVPDRIWHDALRVVRDSIHRHSAIGPGEVSYLDFVAEYME